MEIRSTRRGERFGVKNIKIDISGQHIKLTAELSGNLKAGKSYLRAYMKRLFSSTKTRGELESIR